MCCVFHRLRSALCSVPNLPPLDAHLLRHLEKCSLLTNTLSAPDLPRTSRLGDWGEVRWDPKPVELVPFPFGEDLIERVLPARAVLSAARPEGNRSRRVLICSEQFRDGRGVREAL